MNESEFNELRELSWQRPLTAIEEGELQGFLAGHPNHQIGWEEEAALTHLLGQLPPAPISSNFTALVIQELDKPSPPEPVPWQRWLRGHFRALAWGTACAGLLIAAYTGHQMHTQNQLTQGARLVVSAIPEPDAFANFETIQRLGPLPSMDEELWLALNQ